MLQTPSGKNFFITGPSFFPQGARLMGPVIPFPIVEEEGGTIFVPVFGFSGPQEQFFPGFIPLPPAPPPPLPLLPAGITQRHLTSNYTMLDTDNDVFFDNIGASSEVDVTLPIVPSSAQLDGFIVSAAQNFRVVAPAGVVISVGSSSTSVGGNVVSGLPGSSLVLYALSPTSWVSSSVVGSWAVN